MPCSSWLSAQRIWSYHDVIVYVPCRYDGDIRSSEGLQLVDQYHDRHIAALTELWQANKPKYAKQGTADLKLVE